MQAFIQPLETDEEGRLIGGFSSAFSLMAGNPHCSTSKPEQVNNCQGGNCPQHCTPTVPSVVDTLELRGKNVTNNCMQNCAKNCDSTHVHVGVFVTPIHSFGH